MISKITNNKYFRLFGVLGLLYFLFTQNGNGDLANQSFKNGINDFKKHLYTLEHDIQMAKNQNKYSHQDPHSKNKNDTLQKEQGQEQSQELLTPNERSSPVLNQLNQESINSYDQEANKKSIEFLKTQEKVALNRIDNEILYIDTPLNQLDTPINQPSSLDRNQIKCGDEVKVLISVISADGKFFSRNLELNYVYGSNKNKIMERMLYNSTLNSIKIARIPQKIALANPEVSAFIKKQDIELNSSALIVHAEIKEFKSLKSC
jgi:hypothetical protein